MSDEAIYALLDILTDEQAQAIIDFIKGGCGNEPRMESGEQPEK